MKRLPFATFIALLLIVAPESIRALQEKQESGAPTGLTLEVTYFRNLAPTYLQVPGPGAKATGAWYARFGRIPEWRQPTGLLPVMAVNVISRQEGEVVKINISVFRGTKFHEKEEPVAAYSVKENEKITVGALANFGVEPFEIKVTRLSPTLANPPSITNKTQSLAVTQIEHNNSTLPSYKLSLHNLSAKDVIAIGVNVLVNGQRRLSSVPQGREGRPLIAVGAIYQQDVSSATDSLNIGDDYVPRAPENQEVVITVAVFADGTYEGEDREAAKIRAFFIGRKIQITRVVELLQEVLSETSRSSGSALAKLKTRVSSLSDKVEMSVVDELLDDFPTLDQREKARIISAIEVVLNGVKIDLLKEIQQFERTDMQASGEAASAWLNANKERYEKWLSRL